MKKLGFILGATCAMVVAAGSVVASHQAKVPERDARVIVEVNHKLKSLGSEEAIRESQNIVYGNIRQYVTNNVRLVQRYDELNNAFVMEVNSNDIESIKKVPGVKSVTIDKMHWERVYNDDEYVPLGTDDTGSQATLGENDNISAATMKKPEQTNDGEGTLVAILDNEFHFRAKHSEKDENGNSFTVDTWYHEVYSPLDESVAVKYTFDSIKKITGLNAKKRTVGKKEGEEGSEYLNNKVPFYFDYGGESSSYGKVGPAKFDVHSDLSYHGSHVSSITSANAPTYKGIAPKAQLALMKVFTDYNSKGIGDKLGLSTHTGAYDSAILSALEDCIKLKVDGINTSLGSDLDDFDAESITLKTLTRLNNEGILTSISAGNAGKSSYASTGAYANWSTDTMETGILGSYANNKASMIIASGHPLQVFYENAFQIAGKNVAFEDQIVNRQGMDDDYSREYRMKDLYHGEPLEWVYVPGFGTTADYANLDVYNKIVVVNRGSTSFADKYSIAAGKGAKALVIINNDPTASDFNFRCSFGDGFSPTMPCALVLYKDKALFADQLSGTFNLINKQVSDNPNKYTVSSFSSDGLSYDLDLKPDITAPGDNIRGAVPEHAMTQLTKEEKESEQYKNKCYQYLSGTSMSAPNYAGAQSLILSKVAGPIYANAKAEGRAVTSEELATIAAYRSTVNMRLMSTADPMTDKVNNPETDEPTITSPRMQGAGMVDLGGALNTEVYIEGMEYNFKNEKFDRIDKSKVVLRNNPDIATGNVNISFVAHNESTSAKEYDVTLTVLRPALAHPNDIVTKDYNFRADIEKIDSFIGKQFFDYEMNEMAVAKGTAAYKDVLKVSRDIEYYATEADYNSGKKTTIEKGYYYNAATEGIDWQPLPSYAAQSTKDVLLAKVTGQSVTIQPGESTIQINTYSLTEEQKATILANYEYGCMIEGYVTLEAKDDSPDLSVPYAGFYSGTDKNPAASSDSAPVAEPFNFEKDITKVYPSYLVNDITKSLTGRDNGNFESMIVAGYAERPQAINTDKVLTNDQAFDNINGFYKVGTNPADNQFTDNPSEDIYIGNPATTNTMIIQQFMLRSVVDNYFTITKKGETEPIYRDALEDMLFGDTLGKWSLFKSHVDSSYLSAGYVAHRAYAIVPLFDEMSGEAFPSGEYELKFNYQLMGSGNWVNKTYTLHIDSDAPVFKSATQYRDSSGTEYVRFYFEEERMSYGIIGYNRVEAKYDSARGMYYLEQTKAFVDDVIDELSDYDYRLFVSAVDYARGRTGCIIHYNDYKDFNKGFMSVQGPNILVKHDFIYENETLRFIDKYGRPAEMTGEVLINGFPANISTDNPSSNINNNGNSAFILDTTVVISSTILLVATALIIASLALKKKKGGK